MSLFPRRKPPPEIEVTLTFKMDKATATLFMQSAIERVINESIRLIPPELDESENYADWNEWKPVVVTLWSAIHDAVYRNQAAMSPSEIPYSLRAGERYS